MERRCLMIATNQSDRSPAPGIIPEPAHVTSDAIPLTAITEKRDRPKSGRRNPVRTTIARHVLCKKNE
jgi:hypothetical protein